MDLNPRLSRLSLIGGGDHGVLGERAAHPKPTENQLSLGRAGYSEMGKTDMKAKGDNQDCDRGDGTLDQQGPGTSSDLNQISSQAQEKN
jgi:hypothetical protein